MEANKSLLVTDREMMATELEAIIKWGYESSAYLRAKNDEDEKFYAKIMVQYQLLFWGPYANA